MARKAIYKHLTQVNTSSHPDDGTSPVGSNEWNEAPDPAGMLGFTAQTIASATSVTPTNSVVILSGSTNVSTIAVAETSEYDLLYVVTSGSATLVNTSSPSSSGDIRLLADANKDLSTTTPTILMRKGTAWYEYGGGITNALNDVGDVTVTSNSSGELLKWNGSAWINQTLAESGVAASGAKLSDFAATTSAELAGTISDETGSGALAFATSPTFVTPALGTPASGVATNLSGTAASLTAGAVTTNANLTGDVTSSGNATTIATDAVDIAMLSATGTASSSTFLRGDNSWQVAGGNHTEQGWDVYTSHTGTATTADGIAQMFARRIDANNDGLYIMLWKNGASTEVQIA